MKKNWKIVTTLLLLFALVLGMGQGVALPAKAVSLGEPCYITVVDDELDEAVKSTMVVDIYFIAGAVEVTGYDGYALDPLPQYAGIDLESGNGQSIAQALMQRVLENWEVPTEAGLRLGTQSQELNPGLYLVLVRGEEATEPYDYVGQENGKLFTCVHADTTVYRFSPILISLPTREQNEGNTADPGPWKYAETVSLKHESDATEGSKDVTLEKVDADVPDRFLPGAAFQLYAASPATAGDTMKVYVEGMGEVTLYAQPGTDEAEGKYYITGEDGKVTLQVTDKPYTLCALVEVRAPEGYEPLSEPYYFLTGGKDDPCVRTIGVSTTEPTLNGEAIITGGYGEVKVQIKHPGGEEPPYSVRIKIFSDAAVTVYSAGWEERADGYWYWNDRPLIGDEGLAPFVIEAKYADGRPGKPNIFVTCEKAYLKDPEEEPENSNTRRPPIIEFEEPDWNNAVPMTSTAAYTTTATVLTASENSVTVPNTATENPGIELPETGGMGVTLCYIAGGTLMLGALIVGSAKKRIRAYK